MLNATIEVKGKYNPQGQQKTGSVKAGDGKYYRIKHEMLGMVQEGGVYDVLYEENVYQGKTYNMVKTINPTTKLAQAAQKVVDGAQRARTNEEDARRMWVCALLGHAIEAKVLPLALSDVVEAGKIFLEAHELIFKTPPQIRAHVKAEPDPEFNDEIPY